MRLLTPFRPSALILKRLTLYPRSKRWPCNDKVRAYIDRMGSAIDKVCGKILVKWEEARPQLQTISDFRIQLFQIAPQYAEVCPRFINRESLSKYLRTQLSRFSRLVYIITVSRTSRRCCSKATVLLRSDNAAPEQQCCSEATVLLRTSHTPHPSSLVRVNQSMNLASMSRLHSFQ